MNEGHGFSRATGLALMRALAPEVRLSHRLWRTQPRKDMSSPYVCLEKRTSAAKAVKRAPIYGTAEAVPFVRQSLPQHLRVSEGFMCCPNRPTEKSNLDKSDVQPSLRD
jgi:hypothetical protein